MSFYIGLSVIGIFILPFLFKEKLKPLPYRPTIPEQIISRTEKRKGNLRFNISTNKQIDLSTAPHLFISGTTGFGKSYLTNRILEQLLANNDINSLEVKIIDPKYLEYLEYKSEQVEVYSQPKSTLRMLNKVIEEMNRRNVVLGKMGKRKIDEESGISNIVIIIDETANLFLSDNAKELKNAIQSIAQMGRSSGIHIIMATQHPSRKTVPTEIQINIPTRVSFRVPTVSASRVALDVRGAEKLTEIGEFLLVESGSLEPQHIKCDL